MYLYMGEAYTCDYLSAIDIGGELAFEGHFVGSGEIRINKPELLGGDYKEGGVVGWFRVRQGEPSQMPDPFLQAQVPGPWPAGRGLCTTLFDGQVGAMNPYIKPWKKRWGGFTAGWNTPVWQPALCKIDRGKNPVHMLYQAFTDPQRGLGWSTTIIDESTWVPAAQTLFDERFGLCLPYRSGEEIGSWIRLILDHIGGEWSEDPTTGKIRLHLWRPGYDVDALRQIGPREIKAIDRWQTPMLANTVNEVTAVGHDPVTNKPISITAHNHANIAAQGRVVASKRQFPGAWNRELLGRLAEREVEAGGALLVPVALILQPSQQGISRGEVVSLTWPPKGFDHVPMRVLEVDSGTATDSTIRVSLLQDINGLPRSSYLADTSTAWQRPDTSPKPAPAQKAYEATYRDAAAFIPAAERAELAPEAGFVLGLATRPAGLVYDFTLRTRTGTRPFAGAGRGQFSASATLAAPLQLSQTAAALVGGTQLDQVAVGDEAIIGSEHCRVDAIDPATGAITLGRGCVDTVRQAHPAGTRVWFPGDDFAYDTTTYLDGETVDAKILPRAKQGTLEEALAPTLAVGIVGRQGRPYPPGRARINGQRTLATVAGPFVLTWAHRDRVLQDDQLVDDDAGSIGPAPATRYGVRVLDAAATPLLTRTDIAGSTATVAVDVSGPLTVELWALDDVGDSIQRHRWTFDHAAAPGTPGIEAPTWTPVVVIIDGNDPP